MEVWRPSPAVLLVIILGASDFWRRWKGRRSLASRIYYNLRPAQRATIAMTYVALVALRVAGMNATYLHRAVH